MSQRRLQQAAIAATKRKPALTEGAPFRPFIQRGIVLGADALNGPFEVAPLLDDGDPSTTSYYPCFTFPAGGEHTVDEQVVLWFIRPGEEPLVLEASGSGGGGESTSTLLTGYVRFFTAG